MDLEKLLLIAKLKSLRKGFAPVPGVSMFIISLPEDTRARDIQGEVLRMLPDGALLVPRGSVTFVTFPS